MPSEECRRRLVEMFRALTMYLRMIDVMTMINMVLILGLYATAGWLRTLILVSAFIMFLLKHFILDKKIENRIKNILEQEHQYTYNEETI